MANFSDYGESLAGKYMFTAETVTRPTAWWLAVGTGHTDAGLTGEPSGNGYARQQCTFTEANGVVTLATSETFGPCTGSAWGSMASIAVYTAATGGEALNVGALAAARDIQVGDSLTVAAGAHTFTIS
jgi:hypothetical protein